MECPICINPFTADGHFQPKLLQCGHTFCTDCILNMSYSLNDIKCPYCFTVTPVGILGTYALPVNSTLVQFILDLKAQTQERGMRMADVCCVCKDKEAVKICYNCDPLGCKLCEECCTREHERDFPPVCAHKPIPIENGKSKLNNRCCTHPHQQLTHYSEKHKKIVCKHYLNDQPDDSKADYIPVEAAVQRLKSQLTPVMRNLDGYLKRLEDAHHNISTTQNQLMNIGPNTIQEIGKQFVNFKDMLEKRRETFLQHVETCVSNLCL